MKNINKIPKYGMRKTKAYGLVSCILCFSMLFSLNPVKLMASEIHSISTRSVPDDDDFNPIAKDFIWYNPVTMPSLANDDDIGRWLIENYEPNSMEFIFSEDSRQKLNAITSEFSRLYQEGQNSNVNVKKTFEILIKDKNSDKIVSRDVSIDFSSLSEVMFPDKNFDVIDISGITSKTNGLKMNSSIRNKINIDSKYNNELGGIPINNLLRIEDDDEFGDNITFNGESINKENIKVLVSTNHHAALMRNFNFNNFSVDNDFGLSGGIVEPFNPYSITKYSMISKIENGYNNEKSLMPFADQVTATVVPGEYRGTIKLTFVDNSYIEVPFIKTVLNLAERTNDIITDNGKEKLKSIKKGEAIDLNTFIKDINHDNDYNYNLDLHLANLMETDKKYSDIDTISTVTSNVINHDPIFDPVVKDIENTDGSPGKKLTRNTWRKVLDIRNFDTNKSAGEHEAEVDLLFPDNSTRTYTVPYTIVDEKQDMRDENQIIYVYTWDSDNKQELLDELKSLGLTHFYSNSFYEDYSMNKARNISYSKDEFSFESSSLNPITVKDYLINNNIVDRDRHTTLYNANAIVDFLGIRSNTEHKYLFNSLRTIIDYHETKDVDRETLPSNKKNLYKYIDAYVSALKKGDADHNEIHKLALGKVFNIDISKPVPDFGSALLLGLAETTVGYYSTYALDYYDLEKALDNPDKLSRLREISNYTKDTFGYEFDREKSIEKSNGETFEDIFLGPDYNYKDDEYSTTLGLDNVPKGDRIKKVVSYYRINNDLRPPTTTDVTINYKYNGTLISTKTETGKVIGSTENIPTDDIVGEDGKVYTVIPKTYTVDGNVVEAEVTPKTTDVTINYKYNGTLISTKTETGKVIGSTENIPTDDIVGEDGKVYTVIPKTYTVDGNVVEAEITPKTTDVTTVTKIPNNYPTVELLEGQPPVDKPEEPITKVPSDYPTVELPEGKVPEQPTESNKPVVEEIAEDKIIEDKTPDKKPNNENKKADIKTGINPAMNANITYGLTSIVLGLFGITRKKKK